jgi:hypothetical protein
MLLYCALLLGAAVAWGLLMMLEERDERNNALTHTDTQSRAKYVDALPTHTLTN